MGVHFDLFWFQMLKKVLQFCRKHVYYGDLQINSFQAGNQIIQMYVQEVILEGFKTYMNRTVITNFDPQFNAITGLNGSGKSNILDGIQFLLGSTSKEMLRLKTGLTELIYKEGFAGIQKASVTIKFRCVDKQMRPTGYEGCEELTVTRQITKDKVTKFFINGVTSNLSKVRNLFRSVQLNIENPHFLVKQGQITKIIHLKPLELLGMIEETAGTAYYNKTKTESQKIIEKKQQKLRAINQILGQSIQPQMQKLDADRRRYIAYKDKESLLTHLDQKLRTFEMMVKKRQLTQKELEVVNAKQTIEIRIRQDKTNVQRLMELEAEQKSLAGRSSNPSLAAFNKIKGLLAEKENQRNHYKTRIQKLNTEAISSKQEMGEKQLELQTRRKQKEWEDKILLQLDKQKEQTQGLIQQFGRSSNQKDAGHMIQKQAAQEESRIQAINTEVKVMKSKNDTLKTEIENEKKNQAQIEEGNENLGRSLKDLERQIAEIERMKAPEVVEDPELDSSLLKDLQHAKRRLLSSHFQLNFTYQDPYAGFDRSKVKGKVFMLFRIRQKIHERALQIGAGGKLFQVVVENQVISKHLIERESFGRNVTIIPNNKIRYKAISDQAIQFAAKTARQMGGLARPAYELINYPSEISDSIKYVFSSFMVCSTSEIAKKIAYSPDKRFYCKCVTYDGDIYESGTLTGGYINMNNFILPHFAELQEIEVKLKQERLKLQAKRQKYQEFQKLMNEFRNKQKQVDGKNNRKEKIKNKLMNMSLNIKKRDFTKQLEDIDNKIKQLLEQKQMREMKLNQLKSSLKNRKVKSVKEQRQQLQKEMKKNNTKLNDTKKKISHLEVQIQELKITIKHLGVVGKQLETEIMGLQKKERQTSGNLREYQIQFEKVEAEKKKYQKEMMINEAKYKSIITEQNQLKSAHQKLEIQIGSLQHSIDLAKKQLIDIKKFIDSLLQKCAWLDPEEQYQIDPAFNYQNAKSEFKSIEGEVDKLKRSAKMNIDDHSYQKLHEQYKDLMAKRQTLQNDKETLLNNMHELDEKRTKTLEKCFQSVKNNLGKIFNDLLPGATAHLALIDDRDVTKGAQLSVHFNGVKKELSQLSGGQRSLLALSFILALLLYKPSPFYILDEIDSALDLSHTQNIGYMISQRFPQSQFILISLKEGMFQNANVLYKVHFAQGESKVERQTIKPAMRRR